MPLELVASLATIGSFLSLSPKAAKTLAGTHKSPSEILKLSEVKLDTSLSQLEAFESRLAATQFNEYVKEYSQFKQNCEEQLRDLESRTLTKAIKNYSADRKAAIVLYQSADKLERTIKRASDAARERELKQKAAANIARATGSVLANQPTHVASYPPEPPSSVSNRVNPFGDPIPE